MTEIEILEAARAGDEDAYSALVAPLRHELQVHCYRMLGSNADAEDAVQEALVRAWRGLNTFESRSSIRAWLYRIATNVCLSFAERSHRRVLPVDFGPASDPHGPRRAPITESVWWVEPLTTDPENRAEQREHVELAFIAALQILQPLQRATLILRDVLDFSAAETAELLGSTPAAVNSALQRAHQSVQKHLPQQSQQTVQRDLGDARLTELADRYIDAWQRSDVDGLVNLLVEDAVFSMPPMPDWFQGRSVIAEFLMQRPMVAANRWHLVRMEVNGQLAFGSYLWSDEAEGFCAHGISVLTLEGPKIAEVIAYLEPELVPAFGLPSVINVTSD